MRTARAPRAAGTLLVRLAALLPPPPPAPAHTPARPAGAPPAAVTR